MLLNVVHDIMRKHGWCVQCGVTEVASFHVTQGAEPNVGMIIRSLTTITVISIHGPRSFIILYYDQLKHNYN